MRHLNPFTASILAFTAISLAGCGAKRDPASEPEIEMKAGNYEVGFAGTMMGFAAPGGPGSGETNMYCVNDRQGMEWFHRAMLGGLSTYSSCSTRDKKRVGNLISGRATCPVEPSEGGGEMAIEYSGIISEDLLEAEGQMILPNTLGAMPGISPEQKAQMEMMLKAVKIKFTAKRKGDC